MFISVSCVIAFTAAEKPLPTWLINIIAVIFAVLYTVERIAQLIKESKDDRDI